MTFDTWKPRLSRCLRAFAGLLAISPLAVPTMAIAQGNSGPGTERQVEEIVVTGFRGSLQRSQDLKRNATGTQDSIVAEDIADFPDLNLAESLQRIPGVSISRDSGEGRQISLRGLGPNFTRTRVNGLEALFTTDSGIDQRGSASRTRNFDFSVFASELFNRVDVHKSYEAHLDEGGLAGTVDLHTSKPFDYNGFNAAFILKGIHNDRIDKSNPRAAFQISNTWGNFGALASLAYSEMDTIEEGYHVWSWRQASFGAANVASTVDSAVADRLINSTGADRVFVPRANNIASWYNQRERIGATLSLQWMPSDRMSFDLDGLYGQLSNDRIEYQISTAGTNAFTGDVVAGQLLVDAAIEGDDLVFASFENLDLRTESKRSFGETDFYQLSLKGQFEITDRLSLDAIVGTSDSQFDQPVHDKVFLEAPGHAFSVDWRNAPFGQNTYDFDIADPSEWSLMRTDVREDQIKNSYDTGQLDFKFELLNEGELGFGVQLKSYESSGLERRDRVDWEDNDAAPTGVFQVTDIPVLRPYVVAAHQETFDQVVATGLISRELDASFNRPGTVYEIVEDTFAAYVQYDWSTDWGAWGVRGSIGGRYYETELVSSGEVFDGTVFEQATFEKTYSDFLPAVNVAFDVADDWVWRVGANRNVSRPSLNQLRAAAQVGVADQFINAGNPNLERFVADSFDTSVEYYGESFQFAAGLFYKDMDSFIVTQSQTLPYIETGYPLEFLEFDIRVDEQSEFTVNLPINGESASVEGLEFAFNLTFDFLDSEFLQYLGLTGNLTLADGDTTLLNEGLPVVVQPPGLSKTSHNLTLYYETDVWGARISQSYRDSFITGEGSEQNIVAGFDETTFVDFKSYYNFSDNLKFSFEVINIGDERIRQFLDHRTQSYTESGRNFLLGLTYAVN